MWTQDRGSRVGEVERIVPALAWLTRGGTLIVIGNDESEAIIVSNFRRKVIANVTEGGVIGDIDPGATVSGYPARSHREFLRAQGALYRLAQIVDDLEALVRRTDDTGR